MARRVKLVDGNLVVVGPVITRRVEHQPPVIVRLPVDPLSQACVRGNKSKIVQFLRDHSTYNLTDWDRDFFADFIEGKLKRGKGRPRSSNIHVALMWREAIVKPVLLKVLKEEQRARRKQRMHYGLEDIIHESTVALMESEGMPVTFEALKAAYRNKGKYKKSKR